LVWHIGFREINRKEIIDDLPEKFSPLFPKERGQGVSL